MSRAEERARAFYLPIVMVLGNPDGLYQEECFARDCKIKGFIDGYEQAEKELQLTWQDIQRIVKITDQMVDEDEDGRLLTMSEEDYYKEVLARYVNQSEKP